VGGRQLPSPPSVVRRQRSSPLDQEAVVSDSGTCAVEDGGQEGGRRAGDDGG
jgi:hypothetical protein